MAFFAISLLGTYNNETGLSQESQCKPCPGGMFCDQLGASSPTGQCLAGYYCEYGVDRNNPTGGNRTLVGGACVATGESVTLSLLSMSAIRCLNSIL